MSSILKSNETLERVAKYVNSGRLVEETIDKHFTNEHRGKN
jgi:hypothetical protein